MNVNRKLLPPKAHYLLYFGGVAAFWPYITVFARQLGLSESHVGYVFTIAPIAGIISMPLFGSIADRYKIKKKLFLLFNIINLVAILCFAILTSENKVSRPITVECGTGTSFINHCHKEVDGWNSTVIHDQILRELATKDYPIECQIHCNIAHEESVEFCSNLLNGIHPPPTFCARNETSVPASFLAILDFKKVTPLEQEIDVHIDKIAEIETHGQEGIFRSFSCAPQAKLKSCQINCPDLLSANEAMSVYGKHGSENGAQFSTVFTLYAFFTILGWIAMAVVTSVADALCFQTLGDRPDLYGQQRKWGSIGWGLFTLVSGFLIDVVSDGAIIKNYAPCYWIAGILLTFNFFVCWKWDVEEEERPKALGRRMAALMLEPKITAFIIACIVVGICTGLLWNFLFWYIEDLTRQQVGVSLEAGKWTKLLLGLISVVQCFGGELPFFYIAGRFIKMFGHVNSMAIVMCTFGIRFLLYSTLENPWMVLPIELLQGLTYGIFYANMATYAYVVSPEGTAATVQGIVGAAFEGVGVSIGSLFGGLMYEYWSGRSTFRAFGIFALVMGVLYKGVMMTIDRKFEPLAQGPSTEMKKMGNSLT